MKVSKLQEKNCLLKVKKKYKMSDKYVFLTWHKTTTTLKNQNSKALWDINHDWQQQSRWFKVQTSHHLIRVEKLSVTGMTRLFFFYFLYSLSWTSQMSQESHSAYTWSSWGVTSNVKTRWTENRHWVGGSQCFHWAERQIQSGSMLRLRRDGGRAIWLVNPLPVPRLSPVVELWLTPREQAIRVRVL